jgi:hypothetical protein
MKKHYFLFLLLTLYATAHAQKTTGVVALMGVMTAKLDLDDATSTVTLTLTGPSTRWFALGFNATTMVANTDVVVMTSATVLSDEKLPGGHNAPNTDAVNNWTVASNTVSGSTRTIVASRSFAGDGTDYAFAYSLNSLNLIYSYHNSSGYSMTGHGTNYGTAAVTFTELGVENFGLLDQITVAPNPSNGIFTIYKNSQTPITAVSVFDSSAKKIREIKYEEGHNIDLSGLSKGMYFLEIANGTDKVVKKILIN